MHTPQDLQVLNLSPFQRSPSLTALLPSLQVDSHRQTKLQTAGSHLSCGPRSPLPCKTLLLAKVPLGMVSVCEDVVGPPGSVGEDMLLQHHSSALHCPFVSCLLPSAFSLFKFPRLL